MADNELSAAMLTASANVRRNSCACMEVNDKSIIHNNMFFLYFMENSV